MSQQSNRPIGRKCRISTSNYLGVNWSTRAKKWMAQIWDRDAQRTEHLGKFDTEKDAARVYDIAARERYGVDARVNFPTREEKSKLPELVHLDITIERAHRKKLAALSDKLDCSNSEVVRRLIDAEWEKTAK